jgi:arylsulfatase
MAKTRRYKLFLLILTCIISFHSCNLRKDILFDNVFIILIDACRADHMSLYGYEKKTTPFLNSLLEKNGNLFLNAYASGSWTRISIPSLFLSLPFSFHGLTEPNILAKEMVQSIPINLETLAEILKKNGFFTSLFPYQGNTWIYSPEYGCSRGFDFIFHNEKFDWPPEENDLLLCREQDDKLVDNFLVWINNLKRKNKIFSFIHLAGAHDAYENFERFKNEFVSKNISDYVNNNYKNFFSLNWPTNLIKNDALLKEYVISLYDSDILFSDFLIKKIITAINRRLDLGRTLIIITADHGEGFLDHNNSYSHVKNVDTYNENFRIPLIFYSKAIRKQKTSEELSTIDIAPTILDLLEVKNPKYWVGRSAKRLIISSKLEKLNRGLFLETEGNSRAIIENNKKFIFRFNNDKAFEKENIELFELYNLSTDPLERNNLFYSEINQAKKMYLKINNELLNLQKGINIIFPSNNETSFYTGKLKVDGIIYNENLRYFSDNFIDYDLFLSTNLLNKPKDIISRCPQKIETNVGLTKCRSYYFGAYIKGKWKRACISFNLEWTSGKDIIKKEKNIIVEGKDSRLIFCRISFYNYLPKKIKFTVNCFENRNNDNVKFYFTNLFFSPANDYSKDCLSINNRRNELDFAIKLKSGRAILNFQTISSNLLNLNLLKNNAPIEKERMFLIGSSEIINPFIIKINNLRNITFDQKRVLEKKDNFIKIYRAYDFGTILGEESEKTINFLKTLGYIH